MAVSNSSCCGAWKLPKHPNKQKAEQIEKSATLPGWSREGRIQDKLLPPRLERQTGKYRESRLTRAEAHEQEEPQASGL